MAMHKATAGIVTSASLEKNRRHYVDFTSHTASSGTSLRKLQKSNDAPAERSMAGRTPRKHRIFYLDQCGWRQNAGNLVCFVPSTNQLRHPYLSVGVIRVTFAIPPIYGGTNAF